MRHANAGRRLGRKTSHRIAMFRNMVTSLLQHERITTTDAKAKELRPIAEKLITLGKRGDLHAVRLAASYVRDKKVVTKLFESIAPRFKEREGGYTRIIKLGARPGDNADISILELVEEKLEKKVVRKSPPKLSAKAPEAAVVAAPVAVAVVESNLEAADSQVTETSVATSQDSSDADSPLTSVSDPADTCEGKEG